MSLRLIAPLAASALLATVTLSGDARACGGCFVQQSESTVVTGHRMALSVSPAQTVLWDQIQYAGDPTEFAWVLPVKPGAVLELSTDAWFETLDAATTVKISSPPINCFSGGSGFGCGDDSLAGDVAFPGAVPVGDSVTVVHRGTVGPYLTVTLATDQPGALNQWLTDNNYSVDPSTQPVIDAYVAEGFDFIALRLQPGKGISEMKPVRVVSPGASPTLPLRMVAVGAGANVAITLFLISEGRMAAKNFTNTTTPLDLLAWDFGTQSSNYAELRASLLAQNEGRTWMTTYARRGALLSPVIGQNGVAIQYATNSPTVSVDTIGEAYVEQGLQNGETADSSCADVFPGVSHSKSLVVDPCPPGVPSDDPSCGTVDPGNIDARILECGAPGALPEERLEDMAVALTGMHPDDVWLTRIESALPRAGLNTDLDVEPVAGQQEVDNYIQARLALNIDVACPSGSAPVVLGPDAAARSGRGALLGMLFAAAALAVTRRIARPAALSRR